MEVSVSGWGWGSRNSSPPRPTPRHQSNQDRAQAAAREVSEDTWGRRTTGHGRLMTGPQGQQPEDPGGAFVIKGSTQAGGSPAWQGRGGEGLTCSNFQPSDIVDTICVSSSSWHWSTRYTCFTGTWGKQSRRRVGPRALRQPCPVRQFWGRPSRGPRRDCRLRPSALGLRLSGAKQPRMRPPEQNQQAGQLPFSTSSSASPSISISKLQNTMSHVPEIPRAPLAGRGHERTPCVSAGSWEGPAGRPGEPRRTSLGLRCQKKP